MELVEGDDEEDESEEVDGDSVGGGGVGEGRSGEEGEGGDGESDQGEEVDPGGLVLDGLLVGVEGELVLLLVGEGVDEVSVGEVEQQEVEGEELEEVDLGDQDGSGEVVVGLGGEAVLRLLNHGGLLDRPEEGDDGEDSQKGGDDSEPLGDGVRVLGVNEEEVGGQDDGQENSHGGEDSLNLQEVQLVLSVPLTLRLNRFNRVHYIRKKV